MVTIHQDLVIKTEPDWDAESDSEVQLSSILADKSNPVGISDDVRIVKEVRSVGVEIDQVPVAGTFFRAYLPAVF
jgi:hypothetical protein